MFLRKILAAVCAVFMVLALGACGGGDDDVVLAAPAPVVVSAPAKAEADVTIRQLNTRADVLPGERVRATVAVITCKGMTAEGSCPSSIPTGEIVILDETGAEHELSDLKFRYLGQEIPGWVQNEGGGKYRFHSHNYLYVYQAGSLEVEAVVSPWAPAGTVHTLAVKLVSASYDKTVEVIDAKAELVVRADPAYQPVELWTDSTGYITPNADGTATTVNFTVSCGPWVNNCHAYLDFGRLSGLVPGTPVIVCRLLGGLGGSTECWNHGEADRWGELYLSFGLEPEYLGMVTTYQVTFNPAQFTYLVARQVQGWVNGKDLAPRIIDPNACSALANKNCKG